MAKFQYKAKNISGRVVEGIYEAPDEQIVVEMIREKSFYPIDIKELAESKDIKEYELFAKITTKDIIVFCRQFSAILGAGVALVQALNMLKEQTENKTLSNVIEDVNEDIQKGSSLSVAMNKFPKYFPPILIHMVNAGEVSGTLETSLDNIAQQFEKQENIRRKVKNAMTYPVIVLGVAVIVVTILLVFVVPTFIGLFDNAGVELPLITRLLLGISIFIQNYIVVLIFGGIIIGIGIKVYLNSEKGRYNFDKWKLNMPLLGHIQRKSIAATFSRTLMTLMGSGVEITRAINITNQVINNAYVNKKLTLVERQVSEGRGLYLPIKKTGLFPPLLYNMVMLGEESGNLEKMLNDTAGYFEDEVDDATQQLTAILEPMIIVVLAIIVAFIVIAIALPMFELTNVVM